MTFNWLANFLSRPLNQYLVQEFSSHLNNVVTRLHLRFAERVLLLGNLPNIAWQTLQKHNSKDRILSSSSGFICVLALIISFKFQVY